MPLKDDDRKIIFDRVKKVLKQISPPMVISKDEENVFELIGNKPVPYGSKKVIVPGMYFSSVVARKDMVSYYFFPIYMRPEYFKPLIPQSIKYLKGKSCFNFKKPGDVNEKELLELVNKGVQAWGKSGYLKNDK